MAQSNPRREKKQSHLVRQQTTQSIKTKYADDTYYQSPRGKPELDALIKLEVNQELTNLLIKEEGAAPYMNKNGRKTMNDLLARDNVFKLTAKHAYKVMQVLDITQQHSIPLTYDLIRQVSLFCNTEDLSLSGYQQNSTSMQIVANCWGKQKEFCDNYNSKTSGSTKKLIQLINAN